MHPQVVRKRSNGFHSPAKGKEPLLDSISSKSTKSRVLGRVRIMLVEEGEWKLNKRLLKKPDKAPSKILEKLKKLAIEEGEALDVSGNIGRKRFEELLFRYVENKIAEGKAKELVKDGVLLPSREGRWRRLKVRIKAIRILVNVLGKGPWELASEDYKNNGLGGLLSSRYNGSVLEAAREASC